MSVNLQRRLQIFCAWSGVGYVVALFASMIIMGFFPWPSPSLSPQEVAELYRRNAVNIKLGAILMMFGAMMYIPFSALIGQHVQRFEGERVGMMTIMFIMAAYANVMLTFYPNLWWITAAFRPDRADELVYMLNDASWIQFFGGYTITIPMFVIPAIMILANKYGDPVFPRWVGYFNLFTAVIILPDQALYFFFKGPFAWNGLIAVWIPLAFFGAWFLIMSFYLIRHAVRLPTEPA